jgi:hypothetical protein
VAELLDVGGLHKCTYEQCECQVSTLNTYCSDYCSDADDQQEVEFQCDCKHAPCALVGDRKTALTPDPDDAE